MRTAVTVAAAFCMLAFSPLLKCQDQDQDQPPDALFSPDQLDNLLAPVALYPDPLLAQVLVAATFPDQVDEAARFVRANSNPNDIDNQDWDISVKAVAHYPTALYLLADQLDWTTALGQAYIDQGDDVMASVQRLRAQAQAAGNLQSNADMQVNDDGGDIEIWPAQPQYIYVPEYDPSVVYVSATGFNFGSGFYIGAWLNTDFDWRAHRVIYHGWNENRGWITRSKPYVRPSNTYINERLRHVATNPKVASRPVNYNNLDRFNSVHRSVGYDNVRAGNGVRNNRANPNPPATNKIIDRNFNANDSRINDYRGRVPETPQRSEPPQFRQPRQDQPRQDQPRQQVNRPQEPARAVTPPREERRAPSAFGGNQGGFNAHESSQRGQSSRGEMQRPSPESRPAPRTPESRPAPAPRAPESRPAPPQHQEPARSAPASRDDGGKKR